MRIPVVSDIADALTGKNQDIMDENIYTPAPAPQLDLSQITTPEFQEAQYRKSEANMIVDSRESLIKYVENSGFSTKFTDAAIVFINTLYDRNILFSDLSGKKLEGNGVTTSNEHVLIAYWNAKISALGLLNCAYKSDKNNPGFVVFMNSVLEQFKHRLTRTKGKDRAAILSTRVDIFTRQEQTIGQQRMKGE